jgi:hypothetical protein
MPHTLRCTQCESEMTLAPLGPIEGEEHGVHMKIEGMPAMQCPNGHKRFVAPTFPVSFLDELLAEPLVALDGAGKKGLLRQRYCCPACGEVLDPQGSGRVEADRSIAFDGALFGVHVDLPSYRCPACAHECVEPRDTMASDLMKASAHAFRSARIAPG